MAKTLTQPTFHGFSPLEHQAFANLPSLQPVSRLEIQCLAQCGRDDYSPLHTDLDFILTCCHYKVTWPRLSKAWHKTEDFTTTQLSV